MSRIAVICGTGMATFVENLASDKKSIISTFIAESYWGDVPISAISLDLGKIFVIDRHHSSDENRTPPHEIEHRANVHAVTSCQPELIISVNSVGSMTELLPPGSVGVSSDVLDLSIKPWTFHDNNAVHVDRTSPFDVKASAICEQVISEVQGSFTSSIIVAQCVGPQFETTAEIDALEMLGAHVVGMTLGPEQRLIAEKEIPHISLVCSSNWAAGRNPKNPNARIDHELVNEEASQMVATISACILALLERLT